MIRRWAPCLLLACGLAARAQVPIAESYDFAFSFQYIDHQGPNHCSPDWLVIENGRWFCVRKNAADQLQITQLGESILGSVPWILLRGPVPGDRRLLLAGIAGATGGNPVFAFDPLTLAQEVLGNLPAEVQPSGAIAVDRDGDGRPELAMKSASAPARVRLVSLPGGAGPPFAVLAELDVFPILAAQIDADPQQELAYVDGLSLRFQDASTLQGEAWRPAGTYSDVYPGFAWDADADGLDELAVRTCCPGPLGLLDPARPDWSAMVGVGGPERRPLAALAWSSRRSRSLVTWSFNGLGVVDPESGQAVASLGVHRTLEYAAPLARLDLDADQDEDLLWLSPGTLWVLRNPDGPWEVQFGSLEKRILGLWPQDGENALATVEQFSGPEPSPLRFRLRDALTLGLLHESDLGRGSLNQEFQFGDLHPAPGPELVHSTGGTLTLKGYQGNTLWTRATWFPFVHQFRQPVAPDFTCRAEGCRRLLVMADQQGSGFDLILLLDGATGETLLSQDDFSQSQPLALSDLNGDGLPELVYAPRTAGSRLTARDGLTGELLWSVAMSEPPVVVKRSAGDPMRLAVLGSFGTLRYLDPANGETLRQLQPAPGHSCSNCSLDYLAHGPAAGTWVVGGLGAAGLVGVRRDLRGLAWTLPHLDGSLSALAPDKLHVADARSVRLLRLPPDDGIFAVEFEAW